MTTSWRSPGTTTSRPSVSTRRPPGMPWANTATSLIRRDRSPSLSTRGPSSRTRSRTRSQVSSGRCGTAAIRRSPRSASASPSCAAADGSPAGVPLTTQPTTRVCSPDQYPLAVIASDSARRLTASPAGSGPGSAAPSARSSPLTAPAVGQLATSKTSASTALASAWLSPPAYSLAGPGLSPSTTTTSDRSWTGCQAATIFSSTASSPPDPSCCSRCAVDSGSGGRSAVVAVASAIDRSGPPSARGWATGLTKATFTPRRSRARTRPRQVLARLAPAAVGTTSKVRVMTSPQSRGRKTVDRRR